MLILQNLHQRIWWPQSDNLFWAACFACKNIQVSASSWLVLSSGTSCGVILPSLDINLLHFSPYVTWSVEFPNILKPSSYVHPLARTSINAILFFPCLRIFFPLTWILLWYMSDSYYQFSSFLSASPLYIFYWVFSKVSATKSTLGAFLLILKTDLKIWVASSEKVCGICVVACSNAIASIKQLHQLVHCLISYYCHPGENVDSIWLFTYDIYVSS